MTNPFRKHFTVKRPSMGHYEDLLWVEDGPELDVIISASVQPLKMIEMEALPEGKRTGEAVKIYSDERLYPALQNGDGQLMRNADRLLYDNREWEVVSCSQFQSGIISHYKSYAIREVGN